ncbi:MAG: hypothetical protein JNM06_10475 [Blastocatellia bacterium]|nr:hypothetical protein [Blastocatellia bacterium]
MRKQDIDETYPMLLKVLKAFQENKEIEYTITPEDWSGETEDIINALNNFINKDQPTEKTFFIKDEQNNIKLNIEENPGTTIKQRLETMVNEIRLLIL